jgi:hypothetical protein
MGMIGTPAHLWREPVGLPHHRHAADDVNDINIVPLLTQHEK